MFLVDGNNVIGQWPGWHKDKSGARRKLLDKLAELALARRCSISVVFDGAPETFFPDGSSYRRAVRIYYSARGSNADERIKAMVEASRERRTLFVVTSDRALANYVRRCGAPVISAGEFRRRIEALHSEKERDQGREPPSLTETGEDWMRYFGVTDDDDEQ